MTWPRRLSVLVASLTSAVMLATGLLVCLEPSVEKVLLLLGGLVAGGIPVGLGWWVARHHPDSALAYLLMLPGLQAAFFALEGVSDSIQPARTAADDYLTAASQGTWIFIYVVIAVPLLFFPDGHLTTRSSRVLLTLVLADAAVFTVVAATAPGSFLPPNELSPHVFGTMPAPVAAIATGVCLALLPATLVAIVVQLVRRGRCAVGARRRQFHWLALGAALLPLTLVATWASYAVIGNADATLLFGLLVTYLALPAVMATAVVRPQLFDPGRLLATTTIHLMVTASLLAVFTSVTAVTGLFLARGAPEIAVAATALCALGMAPLRERLQRPVDRWFYPARQAAYVAIASLQDDILSGTGQPEHLQERLRRALRDDTLSIWYLSPTGSGLVNAQGELDRGTPGRRHADVSLGSQLIGSVTTQAELSPELLRDIAARMATLVELGRVRIDLRHALHEADESRSRLLSVGYQERTRLERDLHDGAQQRLVALGMALRLTQRRLHRGVDVSEVLDAAVTELGTAVSELRQVAHGIRPSCLDDGLELALASLVASTPVPISVHVEVRQVDKDTETTAYYVASEAIANAIKHSGAEHIALEVSSRDGRLHVRVADDGGGVARPTAGSGLTGLQDRVGAQGGQLAIHSGMGQGTVVEAVLPCA